MLCYNYNVKDPKGHKQQGHYDKNGRPQEETTRDFFGGPIKKSEKSMVGNGNAVGLVVWINDLVPDVGYPQTGNQQRQQYKQHGVSRPQGHVGTEK